MPVPLLNHLILEGIPGWFDPWNTVKLIAVLSVLAVVKWYSMGASNTSERQMHSKAVMITVSRRSLGTIIAPNERSTGRHDRYRSSSSLQPSQTRRPNNPPNLPVPLRHLPRRLHRRPAHPHQQRAHLRRASRPLIHALDP
jgi:hypothetical protein